MKQLFVFMLSVVALLPEAIAQDALTIDEVQVTGQRRSEADAILKVTQTKAGTRLDRRRLSEDIKRIFRLGFYLDIQVDLSTVDGQTILAFKVTEKPSIRKVVYSGNEELDDSELEEVVDLREFGVLDRSNVTRNAEKIKELYLEKGFFLAEVKWSLAELEDNQVDVVFEITEKDKVQIAQFSLVGNRVLSDGYIKEKLETREAGALSMLTDAGTFNNEALQRDYLRISQFYWDEGYVKARVGEPAVELSPDRSELFITITIDEGPRFKTGPVDVSGDFLESTPREELLKKISLEEGDWFSSARLRESINAVGEVYKDEGYAYANVVPNTRVDESSKTVSLTVDIDKGEKVRIGRIQIVGNDRTRDKVIRRELRIYEGEYYSSSGLKRSERLVNRLGFFEPGGVVFRTMRGSRPNTMDITIEVKEKSTGTFQVGAGFSTLENFVAQAQISQNNLFGRGQSLSLQATLSSIRSIANLRFADDYFLDSRVRFATNVYRFETNYENFARTSLGGDITLGYPLSDDWSVAGTYKLEEVGVRTGGYGDTRASNPIVSLYGSGITSSVRGSLYYDSRNNRLFPTAGVFTNFGVEYASPVLFSENEFTRYQVRSRFYRDVGLGMVLKLNTQWGLVTSPSEAGVPIYERFFVGGPLSVRGFRRNTLGPEIDVISGGLPDGRTTAVNIGGTEELLFNLELEYPIFQKVGIRGVFFLDSGDAFEQSDPWEDKLDGLRHSWGFGIRWFSPIGPLRFEWGFPFEPGLGEESSVFDFSIGNFF